MKSYASLLAILCCSCLYATVTITSATPSVPSPQPLGTPVTFTVTATDSGPGPLAFKFSNSYQSGPFSVVRNFNIGTFSAGVWTSQPFLWDDPNAEGANSIQVVAEDFTTHESATMAIPFTLTTLVSNGNLAVVPTPNPLVALAAIPTCPAGSSARASSTRNGSGHTAYTTFLPCHTSGRANNVYVAGLFPKTTYTIGYQIRTGSTVVNGTSTADFTTGALPSSVSFPVENLVLPPTSQSDKSETELLHAFTMLGNTTFQPIATDLSGHVNWFYDAPRSNHALLTRPLPGGYFLLFQSGIAWSNGGFLDSQLMRKVDLAGTVVKETNIGLLQEQLLALGATDLQSCGNITLPAPVGSSCMLSLSHDAIELPNDQYAFIALVEKIFPPGTQGDTTGLNVDIIGDAIIVVDVNLNAVWYFDAFQHDGGGGQLNINRPAVLGETCGGTQGRCPTAMLVNTAGVTPVANDWLHCNSIQYRSVDGDIILSSRHQDWVMKIDYNNGTGTGNILWRMGPSGDFAFNNINNDPYPWFSHQHDAGFETNGVFTVFDNGNTRVVVEGSGNSRGMALNVDEAALTVTPVLSQDLGYYASAFGSAQLLSNGNYHFQPGFIPPSLNSSYSQEFFPIAGTTSGTEVYSLESITSSYRSFRMADLYSPPTT